MNTRTARHLSTSVFWLTVVLAGVLGVAIAASGARGGGGWGWSPVALGMGGTSLLGAFIVRRAGNAIGWLFQVIALSAGLTFLTESYIQAAYTTGVDGLPLIPAVAWVNDLVGMWMALPVPLLFALFPTGRVAGPRWRWATHLWWAGAACVTAWAAFRPGEIYGDPDPRIPSIPNPVGIPGTEALTTALVNGGVAMVVASGALGVASLVLRYRRARGEERHQLRWLVYVGVLAALLVLTGFLLDLLVAEDALGHTAGAIYWVAVTLTFLVGTPAAVAIAVLKYRLYDIDVVINKTVVFGVLAAFITAVYIGVVVGVGSLLGRAEPDLTLQMAATALVALAFQPVRERARRLANRLVYGGRAEPYEVLARFASRAAGTYASEDVLPRTARVIGEGTGAARAEVWLRVGEDLRLGAAWPEDEGRRLLSLPMVDGRLPELPGATRAVLVEHQGEFLGAVAVAKPAGEPLAPAEESLLDDLAKQAGQVLRNARLTEVLRARLEQIAARAEELRSSRRRIVAAHDAERRRLERNIHDGAQQHLVALAVKFRLARDVLARDPRRAAELLEELRAEIDQALATLRDLAGGIYPAVLEERGIAAALEDQARLADVPVRIEADGLARRPIETEAAVYFACLEALQNAVKHAAASEVRIQLAEAAGHLFFSVRDDGRGFDPATVPAGAGLRNMADRVEALGGRLEVRSPPGRGTTVEGEVPIRVVEAVP
ncbi:MAG TPA: ATP-binding protein [Actinomycetota bacterium]|nr:ATP-binding protein [Actinomycetota bacterium]